MFVHNECYRHLLIERCGRACAMAVNVDQMSEIVTINLGSLSSEADQDLDSESELVYKSDCVATRVVGRNGESVPLISSQEETDHHRG